MAPSLDKARIMSVPNELQAEAAAFDQRIAEREKAGYIPDLRRAQKCEYFYKSFWRDPVFVDLYIGENVRVFLELLRKHGRQGLRLLDVGCGAGYISLELARSGLHVTGIDISAKAIESASSTLATNPYWKDFGSLRYEVRSLGEASGPFDAVLFSGALHHFSNPAAALQHADDLLVPGGLVLCHEPCHESWRKSDAAQVALIRGLLSSTGHWFEDGVASRLDTLDQWDAYTGEIHQEYITEKDAHEHGQSPNDNAASGDEILTALRARFLELESHPGASFIYRLLGGLRGTDETTHRLARLITAFEKYSVAEGFLRPNSFFFIGRKQ